MTEQATHDHKISSPAPTQVSLPAGIQRWKLRSPSKHRWGRRIYLYDMFASFDASAWFRTACCLLTIGLLVLTLRAPGSQVSFVYRTRLVGLTLVLCSFIYEVGITPIGMEYEEV